MKDYLIDTHCHIQLIDDTTEDNTSKLWHKDPEITLQSVINSAAEQKVNILMAIGCNLTDSLLAVKVANKYPNIYASVGIHPHEATAFRKDFELNKSKFEQLIKNEKVKAIGECGLDYFYNYSNKADQIEVFEFQLSMAEKYNLPVVFHVRQAFNDLWPILEKYQNIRGVLHSFTDNMDNLNEALKRGLYIGVNGIVTFAKDDSQLSVYRAVPIKNLLIETDSPYLTPVPYRGKINQPRNVRIITKFVANLLDTREEEIVDQTTQNAINLFNF